MSLLCRVGPLCKLVLHGRAVTQFFCFVEKKNSIIKWKHYAMQWRKKSALLNVEAQSISIKQKRLKFAFPLCILG